VNVVKWIKKTASPYKQIENVQLENVTDGIKQKIISYCKNQYTWSANSMQCNTWRRYESDSMELTAGWLQALCLNRPGQYEPRTCYAQE
jgi:tRNA A37 N6-isopentenylltransferase MiaA